MNALAGRSAGRRTFLADLVVTAVEHGGYGFPRTHLYTHTYSDTTGEAVDVWADISDRYDDDSNDVWHVDGETMARGIGVIVRARKVVDPRYPDDGPVNFHPMSDIRLYVSDAQRKRIMHANRTNDAGELDVIDALAILECAIFGAVTYG